MVRGLILSVALVATAAQAQESSKAAKGTDRAVLQKGEPRAITPASRAAPGRPGPFSRSVASRDAGVDAGATIVEGTSGKPADCSIAETLLQGVVPVVRTYPPPRAETRKRTNAWKQAPYVAAAARCGRLYILQIWSQSKDEWVVAQASLKGPNGEALEVNALRFNNIVEGNRWNINVIVAEAPTDTKLVSLALNLTGEDGRGAQPEVRNLP